MTIEAQKPIRHQLCAIPGDGIGLEVVPAAVSILQAIFPDIEVVYAEAGWNCFIHCGQSVPPETLEKIRACGAALFGAVSSPAHKVPGYYSAILTIRQSLDLYANLRPVRSLAGVTPRADVDMLIVRENSEGLYAGRERKEGDMAIAERVITRCASERIAAYALRLARLQSRHRLTIVHKANVLPITDGLFRDVVRQVAEDERSNGLNLEVDELLVDIAALKMVAEPERFDVLVTTNLFGDSLSDAAAYWCGGLELAPSLNVGDDLILAEPVHGSAPDIAGMGIANPAAAILSAALLVRYAWKDEDAAQRIERAVERTFAKLANCTPLGSRAYPTSEIQAAILKNLV